jgi:hypothetical protein
VVGGGVGIGVVRIPKWLFKLVGQREEFITQGQRALINEELYELNIVDSDGTAKTLEVVAREFHIAFRLITKFFHLCF